MAGNDDPKLDVPTITLYRPAQEKATGASVVICPGGGYGALAIDHEGKQIAEWLNGVGIAGIVLKYRLGPRYHHPAMLQDAGRAIRTVRARAKEWSLDPKRVAILGFSAGGTVAAAAGFGYKPESRPAFVAPIYAAVAAMKNAPVPSDAPPMFLAAATDDQLNLAPDSIQLYTQWTAAHKSAELHMYAKGGHGFGMRQQGIPTDHWIERFGEWLDARGLLKK